MVEKFHVELSQAKKDVDKMGHLAKDMLTKSVEALIDLDKQKAEWVISNKFKLADMDDKIEDKTLRLIALYQPMASDLREIACILKMITYLNRIGRYGKDIAKLVFEFEKSGHIKKLVSIPHMAEIVEGMIDDALSAFEMCFKAIPGNYTALKKIGDCYQHMGKTEAAKEAYRQYERLLKESSR